MLLINEWIKILILFSLVIIIAIIIQVTNYLLIPKDKEKEKLSSYECGFNPYQDSRIQFDINFYVVAILFIIFDLEIAFLFPISVILTKLTLYGYYALYLFILIINIGIYIEWFKDVLNWSLYLNAKSSILVTN